jgi:hypothetical protein
MTDEQRKRKEEAESDAEWLLLLLLLNSPRVVFRANVGRFYVDGRSVPVSKIRQYLNRIERRIGNRVVAITDDLAAGRITLNEWKQRFTQSVTTGHVLAGALALGGIAAAVTNRTVQARINGELRYAHRFGRAIRKDDLSVPRIKARAKSYFRSIAITYGIVQMILQKKLGISTECRRVRRASESCSGCVRWSYRWMPIDEMPRIGSLDCGGRCRCYIEYR